MSPAKYDYGKKFHCLHKKQLGLPRPLPADLGPDLAAASLIALSSCLVFIYRPIKGLPLSVIVERGCALFRLVFWAVEFYARLDLPDGTSTMSCGFHLYSFLVGFVYSS